MAKGLEEGRPAHLTGADWWPSKIGNGTVKVPVSWDTGINKAAR